MTTKKIILLIFLIFIASCLFSQKNNSARTQQTPKNLSITPEYQRNLKELALTIPQKLSSEEETLALLGRNYRNLLLNIPIYTELIIFTHRENKEVLHNFLASLKIPNKVTYYFSENSYLELWAQDYFEPVKNGDSDALLLPLSSEKIPAFNRIKKRNSSITNLENSLIATFFFEGGNIMAANNSFGNFVFIDFETIKKTQDLYKTLGENLSPLEITQLVQETFSAKVIVMGDTTREDNFVHLDQSILFLEDNNVLVYEVSDSPGSKAFLQHRLYQKTLSSLGFNVIKILTSSAEIKNSTSSLNALVFKDLETQEKKIIFPVYPAEIKAATKQKSSLKKDDLTGNALSIFDLLIELGYLPFPVFDSAIFQQKGSLHCISNVIR